jgi:UDP-N-acetylglucosamine:LPS N-acetylglucosamine transferase
MQGCSILTKLLAVTSGGGHWDEMMVLREDLAGVEMIYANTFPGLAESAGVEKSYLISDCNRNTPMSVIWCAWDIFSLIRRERPDLIMSTGAAPGVIAIMIGKILGCRTIWVDSIANSIELSMSGRIAGRFADLWLTQWEHLSKARGPHYWGSIL